jgi:hypothetical protein
VDVLEKMNPVGVYIWTPASNVCGVLAPVSLQTIQWGFGFDLIKEGILVLLTADLADKMLLDFSQNSSGDHDLEIEVSGSKWGNSTL